MCKKIYSILATMCMFVFLIGAVLTMSACGTVYSSKSGTKAQIAGTYELTKFIQKDANMNDIDRIDQLNIKAYMVINQDGHGYYVYQDANESWYDSTYVEFIKDDDEDDLYKAVEVTTGEVSVKIDKKRPGCKDEPVMGFNVEKNTLSYFIPEKTYSQSWLISTHYTDVAYTKISDDITLNTVSGKLNRDFSPLPRYELKNLDGILYFTTQEYITDSSVSNPEREEYKYYVVDFDAITETANIYYERVDSEGRREVQENVKLDIQITRQTEHSETQVAIKFFDKYYYAYLNGNKRAPSALYYTVYTEVDEYGNYDSIYSNEMKKYFGQHGNDINKICDELKANYA